MATLTQLLLCRTRIIIRDLSCILALTAFLFAGHIIIPSSGHAEDILNGLTRVPPYDISDEVITGFAPPTGYGHFTAAPHADPATGTGYVLAEMNVRSDWPWPFALHPFEVYNMLGSVGFNCIRTGSFAMDASVLLRGMAGIYVPYAPDFLGGAEAHVQVIVRLSVREWIGFMYNIVHTQDFVVFQRDGQYSREEPTWWSDAVLNFTTNPVTLFEGGTYEACVKIIVSGSVGVTGQTPGAWAYGYLGSATVPMGGQTYNVYGYTIVQNMAIRDLNPDLASPVTEITFPPPECTLFCYEPFVTLAAFDPAGGFGMGGTYWQFESGPIQEYTGTIMLHDAGTFNYWSVDRAGNEETPHKSRYFNIIHPPDPPLLCEPMDGAYGLQQPLMFGWNPVEGADRYTLQIDDDPEFGSPEVSLDNITMPPIELDSLPAGGTLYWHVAAHHGACNVWGAWSPPSSFSIDPFMLSADVRPGTCPNYLRIDSPLKTSIAFLGEPGFGVTIVDAGSVRLTRDGGLGEVAPVSWAYEDVGTPFFSSHCECWSRGGDGVDDLVLRFRTEDIVTAFSLGEHIGETIPVKLVGISTDGAGNTIIGEDCLIPVSGLWAEDILGDDLGLAACAPSSRGSGLRFDFYTGTADRMTFNIYDVQGRVVATLLDEVKPPGVYSLIWDGASSNGNRVTAGVYFARLRNGSACVTRKVTILY